MVQYVQVFLGASAVLSNGTVMSRAGSAAVAMMATACSKPVIICCETYKFHEKVQLDSITANELGDPAVLEQVACRSDINALKNWEQQPRLGNIVFRPATCVTCTQCASSTIADDQLSALVYSTFLDMFADPCVSKHDAAAGRDHA